MFNQFHGDQIYRGHRPIEQTVQAILEQDSSFPAEVVKQFVNVRFFRRIKLMNINLKEKHRQKSVLFFKQTAQFLF